MPEPKTVHEILCNLDGLEPEMSSRRHYSDQEIKAIKAAYMRGCSMRQIASATGRSYAAIRALVARQGWHLTPKPIEEGADAVADSGA